MNENKILDFSQDILGRRKIKVVLHEIYPDRTRWNENGITYLEQYVRDNADSVKGMPLCAEFLDDDKDVPYGHGLTGSKRNFSIFEDSVQVGTCKDWSIEDIEINGQVRRCLCATGYINENRYPNFVDWLDNHLKKGQPIYGSIEFAGTKDNDGEIIYDGGYKEKGRVPMVYDYIGYSIISVRPADNAALVLDFEKVKTEFDNVFEDKNAEKATILKNEFDDIFAETEKSKFMEDTDFDVFR